MAIEPLRLGTRLTKPPGSSPRIPLEAEPAFDINAISSYLDNIITPAINLVTTGPTTPGASDIIEVSG